jgi:Tat protein secretion system quality control protein TatD with DNase activity
MGWGGGLCGTYRREEKVLHGFGGKTCRKEAAWRTWTQMEKKLIERNGIGECGLDLFLPGYSPETGCCKVENELSGFKICWEFCD